MNNNIKTIQYFFLSVLVLFALRSEGQSARQEILLKDNWRFITDPAKSGAKENWAAGLPANAMLVQVPHTWNVMEGLEEYTGLAWYEKTFMIPDSWKNKQARIKFDAVYHDAVIYLNGRKIQEHLNSGYTTFYADITKYLNYEDSNRLVVSVSNEFSSTNLPYQRSFDWPNDGGIIRAVHLIASDKPSIRYVHVTPLINFSDTTAIAGIDLKLWENDIDSVNATISIAEKKTGKTILSETVGLRKSGDRFYTNVDLGKIHLWHFNDPFLYEVEVVLHQNNKSTDNVASRFGCREIKLVGNKLLFNREVVRLPGMEYMPSSHPAYGSAEPRWVMDSVVNMFKDLNVTISRFHWQVDEYMLDLMDEKGILLQEEIPWWQQPGKLSSALVETAKQQFTEMVERDYNHPCIFAWGISNEVYGNDRDSEQYVSLKNFVKKLDSNRMAVVVSNETIKRKQKDESFIGDLPTWNEYIGTWFGKSSDELPGYFKEIESFIGDRPLLITENGLCEPRFAGGDLRRIEDMIYHYGEWAKRDYIAGCIYFCLNDYRTHRGEDGVKNFKARVHGVTDLYFRKKPSYYVFKQLAAPVEIMNVQRVNDSRIEIELLNKKSLPSYTLKGYEIRWKTMGNKSREKQLPLMKPGNKIRIELENLDERISFDILTPAGFVVTSYPFIN